MAIANIPKPMKNGNILIACRIMFGAACWMVREKKDNLGECSIYFSVLIQDKAHPSPTNRDIESRGTEFPNRHMTAPITWKRFEMQMIIDQ